MGGHSRSSPPRLGRVCITAGKPGELALLAAGKLGGLALLADKCVGHVAGQTLGLVRLLYQVYTWVVLV